MTHHPNQLFHYCPQCGQKTLHPAEEDSRECSSCNFHFFFNVATAVSGIITNDEGEILLITRGREPGKGMLDTPGGFMNSGETAEETLQREVHEEVGIEIQNMRYFTSAPNQYTYGGITYPIADLSFTAKIESGTPEPQDDEVTSLQFIAPKDIDLATIAFPSIRAALEKYILSV